VVPLEDSKRKGRSFELNRSKEMRELKQELEKDPNYPRGSDLSIKVVGSTEYAKHCRIVQLKMGRRQRRKRGKSAEGKALFGKLYYYHFV